MVKILTVHERVVIQTRITLIFDEGEQNEDKEVDEDDDDDYDDDDDDDDDDEGGDISEQYL